MDKKSQSERDICTKFIAPAIQQAGWDIQPQLRDELSFTNGRIKHSVYPGILRARRDITDWMGPAA